MKRRSFVKTTGAVAALLPLSRLEKLWWDEEFEAATGVVVEPNTVEFTLTNVQPGSRWMVGEVTNHGEIVEVVGTGVVDEDGFAACDVVFEEPKEVVVRVRKVGILPFETHGTIEPDKGLSIQAIQVKDPIYGS